jgi:uncharacterized protein (TIGR02246 family)
LTTRTSAVAVLAALLLTSACRIERTERPAMSDAATVARSDIMATLVQYEAAVASGEARRAASYFAPDGSLTMNGVDEVHGRPDIGAQLEQLLAGGTARVALHSEIIDLTSSAAWQIGTFEHAAANDSAPAAVRGRFMIRWLRGPEATWRIHHLMLSAFPADSASPPQ